MNARDTAINIVGALGTIAEPAGASGCFWRIAGPRRNTRAASDGDLGTMRRSIEQALDSRDARIRTLEAELAALRDCVYETKPGEMEFVGEGWTYKQAFMAERERRIELEARLEAIEGSNHAQG